ncbi:hypothetical protein NMY22_g5663 [Coprinellus aureogranulatus]|nr:hypothetical protein NMY22_g5663 [Coprinellus aureogranulatus]
MISPTSTQTLVLSLVLAAALTWPFVRRFIRSHPLDDIPGPEPLYSFVGHLPQIFTPNAWAFHESLANNYGRVSKLVGLFRAPILYIYDPKALYHIFVKDQQTFDEVLQFIGTNQVAFGHGLLSTLGDRHKRQRKMLNPVFSVAHIKKMIPTFFSVTGNLQDAILSRTADGPAEVDMVQMMSRTAFELISQCGLGKSFNAFTDGDEDEYITALKMLLPLASGSKRLLLIRTIFMPIIHKYNLGTSPFLHFLVSLIPWRQLRLLQEKIDIMHRTSVDIFNSKKKAMLQGNDTEQLDFLSILSWVLPLLLHSSIKWNIAAVRENAKASAEDRLPDDQVIAQISTLMFAAMDTTSNALSRILWLLASHQDVQDKLRNEIREAKQKFGEPEYEQLMALPYLDAVIRETLRRYSPAPTVPREAHRDWCFNPLSKPIKTLDGKETSQIFVPKGTLIIVHVPAINTDPELWGPDSNEWKPERWFSPLPEALLSAKIPGVYSHLMTFIGGGRSCIGFKFSELEMKVVLFALLDLFKFTPSSKEIYWNMIGVATPSTEPEIKVLFSLLIVAEFNPSSVCLLSVPGTASRVAAGKPVTEAEEWAMCALASF